MQQASPAYPNTFVVGAAKCGTTSFVNYLKQHPEVFVPDTKEPNFYVAQSSGLNRSGPIAENRVAYQLHRFSVSDREDYEKLYAAGRDHRIRIDGSVRYLYHAEALSEAARECPDAKFVALLRDPVERIVSHWRMNRQNHLEPLELSDALDAEDERVALGWGFDWHYRRVSRFAPQISFLRSLVPADQIHLIYYGDFARRPMEVLDAASDFLDVPPLPTWDVTERGMVPAAHRVQFVDRIVTRPNVLRNGLRRFDLGRRALDRIDQMNQSAVAPVTADTLTDIASRVSNFTDELAEVLSVDGYELGRRMASKG